MITLEQYRKAQEYKELGLSISKVAKIIGVSYDQIRYVWNRNEQDIIDMLSDTSDYKLENYRQWIVEQVRMYPQISNTNLMAKMEEQFSDINVSYSTFNRYMQRLRNQTGLTKPKSRITGLREDQPPGYEAQVDFGQFKMKNMYGSYSKVYFFVMVLSYSRMRFAYFSPDPFTTETAIEAHNYAFEYFGGRTQTIMYDLDRVFVVSENRGNIIFVKKFEDYIKKAGFSAVMCRAYDPESKGRVENSVKFVKENFLLGRTYCGIDRLNVDCLNWLDRNANQMLNSYTKKPPRVLFKKEAKLLKRVNVETEIASKVLTVEHGFVEYEGNRYELPLSEVQNQERVRVDEQEDMLIIYKAVTNELICKHQRCYDIGISVTLPKKASKINATEIELVKFYKDNPYALQFIELLKVKMPRYVNPQLRLLKKALVYYTEEQMNNAFKYCIKYEECTMTEFTAFMVYRYGTENASNIMDGRIQNKVYKRAEEIREILYGTGN